MMGGWVGSKPYRSRADTRGKVNMDVVPKQVDINTYKTRIFAYVITGR